MGQPAALGAVQPGMAVERRGIVQAQDELDVSALARRLARPLTRPERQRGGSRELPRLPELPLVLAEVLHDEGADTGDLQEATRSGATRWPSGPYLPSRINSVRT